MLFVGKFALTSWQSFPILFFTMKTARRKPPSDHPITQRILKLMDEQGFRDRDICAKTGMGSDTFSRKISGERKWSWTDLEMIAPVLGLKEPWNLFREPQSLPIIPVSALGFFDQGLLHSDNVERISLYLEGEGKTVANTYCLKVSDRSMLPGYPQGTKFLVQGELWQEIKNEDLVVYCNPENHGTIRQIILHGKDSIILRGLNPSVPDMVLPINQIRQCDRVIQAIF
jgi:Peptidase S24-like